MERFLKCKFVCKRSARATRPDCPGTSPGILVKPMEVRLEMQETGFAVCRLLARIEKNGSKERSGS
jgi:hypothetical protein